MGESDILVSLTDFQCLWSDFWVCTWGKVHSENLLATTTTVHISYLNTVLNLHFVIKKLVWKQNYLFSHNCSSNHFKVRFIKLITTHWYRYRTGMSEQKLWCLFSNGLHTSEQLRKILVQRRPYRAYAHVFSCMPLA